MLLAGRKGHLALMEWQRSRLICEVQVRGLAPGTPLAQHRSTEPALRPQGLRALCTGHCYEAKLLHGKAGGLAAGRPAHAAATQAELRA